MRPLAPDIEASCNDLNTTIDYIEIKFCDGRHGYAVLDNLYSAETEVFPDSLFNIMVDDGLDPCVASNNDIDLVG